MNKTVELLGDKAEYLLSHTCKTIDKSTLHLPSPHTVEEVWAASDRNIPTLNSLQRLLGHGRLGGTGYVSILPVDQGIEHTAGASFAPNPIYFDPENIVRLAIEGGCNGGFRAIGFGKTDDKMYTELASDHPIDLCRYQVANSYMGRVGLINSGGESHGASDLADAVATAVINKRAGGMGLISGRKAFQRPMNEGIELLHAIQDVYLDPSITIA